MAHPFNSIRNDKVQKSRVSSITKNCGGGMATGGAVIDSGKPTAGGTKSTATLRASGGAVKARADRPARARGGRLGKKHGTKGHTVNVIVAPHPDKPAMPPMIPGVGAPPPSMPVKPMMPPPPGPGITGGPSPALGASPGGPPLPPPGMRYAGGRTRKTGGKVEAGASPSKKPFTLKGKPNDASVGNLADADTAGIGKGRTPRQGTGTNKQDTPNIGRKASILKATGGPITSNYGFKKGMAPHAKGGAMGGLAKKDKANHPSKYVRA